MKAKYLIIASLILAILTIGAVSASQDIVADDELAVNDDAIEIEEAPAADAGVIDDSKDSDTLEKSNDAEELGSSSIAVQYNSTVNLADDDAKALIADADEGINGEGVIEVKNADGEGIYNYTWSFFYEGYHVEPTLDDLHIYSPGTYKLDVYWDYMDLENVPHYDLQSTGTINVTETYDAGDFNFDLDEYIDFKFDSVLEVDDYPTKGTLIVTVNGNKRFSAVINDPDEDDTEVQLSDLNITSNGQYTVSAKFIVNSTSQEVILGEKTVEVDVDNWDADKYVSIYDENINIRDHNAYVGIIEDNDDCLNGTLTVEVDGVKKLSQVFKEDDDNKFELTVDNLGLYNNITTGSHTVKVVYMKNGVDKHELIRSVEFYVSDRYVSISSDVDVLSHYDNVVYVEDMDDYLNGTLTVYIDGVLKFTKNFAASEEKCDFEVTVDDLKVYNSLFGTHNVKAVFMKNGVEEHELEIPVEFTVTPDFVYSESLSVGEKETLVINYLKTFTGTATLYNAHWDGDDWVKGTVAGSAKFSNGVATIPFGSLSKGAHYFLVNITGYPHEQPVEVYVSENTPGLSASVSASEITVGGSVVVKFNSPTSTNHVQIDVDGNRYASVIASGAVSQEIKGLTAGTHKIKVFFEDEGKFYSNTFYVTVKNPTPAKKDTIKLTLKKVKVKKSAKKLVLQATLKINGKAVKGKVIKFKFNKKTYKAKTNKKGVAKVTIKKKVLKKLKVGKKVKIQATYGKTTKKLTVKVKK